MELINQLLRAFLALLLFTVQQVDAAVTVTFGEFAGGVFIEWDGFFSVYPTNVGTFFNTVSNRFSADAGEAYVFATAAGNAQCKYRTD